MHKSIQLIGRFQFKKISLRNKWFWSESAENSKKDINKKGKNKWKLTIMLSSLHLETKEFRLWWVDKRGK